MSAVVLLIAALIGLNWLSLERGAIAIFVAVF